MDLILVAAYLLPLLFLAVFIGKIGKKFLVFILWGFIAAIPAFFLEEILFTSVQAEIPLALAPITISPIVEEFFKALPIIVLAVIAHRQSDQDLFLYAMASGIGFSIIEGGLLRNPDLILVLSHSFSTALMHGCTCGIIGYGIVLIRNFDRRAFPALLFGFYTLAVTVHALYNLLGSEFFGITGLAVDMIMPLVLFFILLIGYHVDVPSLFRHRVST